MSLTHLVPALALLSAGFTAPLPEETQPPERVEVFVAPRAARGDAQDGDGSRERPYGSIEAARDHVRQHRTGPRPTITLLDGTWRLEATVEFDARDEGLLLRADAGSRPRLVGGALLIEPELRPLDPRSPADQALAARLPTDAARAAVRVVQLPADTALHGPVRRGMGSPVVAIGSELFVNGTPLLRARWPDTGFASVGEVLDAGSIPRNRASDVALELRDTGPGRGGRFRPAGVTRERLARWTRAEDVWAFGYWFHDWADEQLPIAAIEPELGTLELGPPHRYGLAPRTSFYVCNLIEELDTPGEFVFDSLARRVVFWPPVDDEGAAARIGELVVTTLGAPLLSVKGARGLELRGLELGPTRGPAVVVEDGVGIVVRDCRITGTGTDGVRLQGEHCAVLDCVIRNTGATGVSLEGGDRPTLEPGANLVEGTRVHGFGRVYRTYQPAVRLAGVGQLVRGNEFAHASHSAIIFTGNEHRIEDNEIFDVLRETGDSGAIYCGRDWTMHGTRITGNFIHHLGGTEGRWQNAIYLDDMASGIEVSNNVIWRCHWGMLVGGGRDVVIRANVFVECDLGIRFDARGVGWMAPKIADPELSTLHRRLAAMPIANEPWASRYPSLGSYLDDRFGRPVGSRIQDNLFFKTPLGRIDDRECVLVRGNQEQTTVPDWILSEQYVETGERLGERVGAASPQGLPEGIAEFIADRE